MKIEASHLYEMFLAIILSEFRYKDLPQDDKDAEIGATSSHAILMKHRSQKGMSVPLIVALIMISRGINKQVTLFIRDTRSEYYIILPHLY